MEVAPLGAVLVFLALASQGNGYVIGFLVMVGVQALVWAVVWWLLACWLARSTRAAAVAAVLVVLAALAPIYGEGGHGSSRTGSALEKYRQSVREAR
jgi:hypothetical protein